jgi:putative ABC transport system ATP-binding protein
LNETGITVVLVTHEHDIAHYAKRNIVCKDGNVLSDYSVDVPNNAAQDLLANHGSASSGGDSTI